MECLQSLPPILLHNIQETDLLIARALWAFGANGPGYTKGDLAFAKGDVLVILRYQSAGWWEAEVQGKPEKERGSVPKNYLQVQAKA